ncbi:MAG: Bax inhibitor-1/YccA family protein [Gammaproteobacteria bacterium]|nr:Bax inhibitor-1/YccA family protein [Gammaproteobacteria bacterium]
MSDNITLIRRRESALATNAVLRNTYILLSLTLLFSALTASWAMFSLAPPLNPFVTLLGYIGLLFLTTRLRNSGWGIVSVFALTGFMGYTLGPVLNVYLHHVVNGQQIVITCLGTTGVIFMALSLFTLITKKDFSFMGSFLMMGLLVAFLVSLAGLLFHMPVGMMAASAMFVLLSSGIILYKTSQIIHGGETNYIMATIDLYVALYNIFVSLLMLLGGNGGSSRD